MKHVFKQILSDFWQNPLKSIKNRNLTIDMDSGKIISIIWPRRSGKSYYLFGIIGRLLALGVDKKRIVYVNFEDERLRIHWSELQLLIDAYLELYDDATLQETYFFFDEIQNIDNREKFVRRIYDEWIKNIFITWSNAKLLSKEISTSLRGRSITYELLPLSFEEFLQFKGEVLDMYVTKDKAKLLNLQKEFLVWWWYPEILSFTDDIKLKTLQEYFDVMLYNDIVERYKIKDATLLKQFIKLLLQTTTKEFSINKIGNDLKSLWFAFDKNILYDFLEYLHTIYFSKIVSKYDFSFKKQTLKKHYVIDTWFMTAMSFQFTDDYGKLLENAVCIHLYRQYGDHIFFLKNGSETDFVLHWKQKEIYQVCYDFHNENRKREIQWCRDAMKKFKIHHSKIITFEQEEEIVVDEGKIQVLPFYKWVL